MSGVNHEESFVTWKIPHNRQRAVIEGGVIATIRDIAGVQKSGKAPGEEKRSIEVRLQS